MDLQQLSLASPLDETPPPVKAPIFITCIMKMMQDQSPLHASLNHTHALTVEGPPPIKPRICSFVFYLCYILKKRVNFLFSPGLIQEDGERD